MYRCFGIDAEEGRIEMCKVTIDDVGHLLVACIKIESLTFKQTLTKALDVLTHVMECDAIGQIRHIEGFGHLFVGHCPLFVKHGQQGTEEDETTTRIKDLMSICDEMGDDGEFSFVSEIRRLDGESAVISFELCIGSLSFCLCAIAQVVAEGIEQPTLERLLFLDALQRLIGRLPPLAEIEEEIVNDILIIVVEVVTVCLITVV